MALKAADRPAQKILTNARVQAVLRKPFLSASQSPKKPFRGSEQRNTARLKRICHFPRNRFSLAIRPALPQLCRMVAELAKPLKPARPKPAFGPGSPIPISTKLTVRSFYLLQGLKPSQIAPMVGLSAQQVANLAIREGWSKQRTAKKAEKESRALERQDARAEAEIDQIQRAIATRTEELSVKTLDHCAEILKAPSGSEKELQMASGAAMNFVKIARMSRGLDQRQSERNGAGDQLSVNLFVVRGETVESAAKKVEPVEIVATALSTT